MTARRKENCRISFFLNFINIEDDGDGDALDGDGDDDSDNDVNDGDDDDKWQCSRR